MPTCLRAARVRAAHQTRDVQLDGGFAGGVAAAHAAEVHELPKPRVLPHDSAADRLEQAAARLDGDGAHGLDGRVEPCARRACGDEAAVHHRHDCEEAGGVLTCARASASVSGTASCACAAMRDDVI